MMLMMMLSTSFFLLVSMVINTGTSYQSSTITTQKMEEEYLKSVECGLKANPIMKCWKNNCGLRVVDNLFADEDIIKLHRIVQKGLGTRQETGGPSILDLNTGYVRDSNGLVNLFASDQEIYTPEDFNHYGDIINRLKQHVMETFQLEELYFTAPTFITRLDGRKEWNPQSDHDEYWHVHADMNSTSHYHYSGLLYMSTFEQDFTGGRLHFVNRGNYSISDVIVEPLAGRVAIFTSGSENPHHVERVLSGQRFVLAFWFTCDSKKQFQIFLDGKAHTEFSYKIKESLSTNKKEEL